VGNLTIRGIEAGIKVRQSVKWLFGVLCFAVGPVLSILYAVNLTVLKESADSLTTGAWIGSAFLLSRPLFTYLAICCLCCYDGSWRDYVTQLNDSVFIPIPQYYRSRAINDFTPEMTVTQDLQAMKSNSARGSDERAAVAAQLELQVALPAAAPAAAPQDQAPAPQMYQQQPVYQQQQVYQPQYQQQYAPSGGYSPQFMPQVQPYQPAHGGYSPQFGSSNPV
jgi:hypothetical protein